MGKGLYLGSLLKMTPSACIYPVKFSSSDKEIIDFDTDYGNWDWCYTDGKLGTATITAKCGGKTAKIIITVVE